MRPSQNSFRNFGCSLVASCIKSAGEISIGWIDWALLKSSSGEYFTPVSISTVDSFCN